MWGAVLCLVHGGYRGVVILRAHDLDHGSGGTKAGPQASEPTLQGLASEKKLG